MRSADWRDGRSVWKTDDASLVDEIRLPVAGLPSYGYRHVWGLLRSERELQCSAPVNSKRVYRVMRLHDLLLHRRTLRPCIGRRHDGEVAVPRSNQRWCSEAFEFRCDNGDPLRVTFALDCCDREAMSWAATTGGHSGDVVRDVMLAAVEHRFGNVQKRLRKSNVTFRMQHSQISHQVLAAADFPSHLVKTPTTGFRNHLPTDRTRAGLIQPHPDQLSPTFERVQHREAQPLFEIGFPLRVKRVGCRLDFAMSPDRRACNVV